MKKGQAKRGGTFLWTQEMGGWGRQIPVRSRLVWCRQRTPGQLWLLGEPVSHKMRKRGKFPDTHDIARMNKKHIKTWTEPYQVMRWIVSKKSTSKKRSGSRRSWWHWKLSSTTVGQRWHVNAKLLHFAKLWYRQKKKKNHLQRSWGIEPSYPQDSVCWNCFPNVLLACDSLSPRALHEKQY